MGCGGGSFMRGLAVSSTASVPSAVKVGRARFRLVAFAQLPFAGVVIVAVVGLIAVKPVLATNPGLVLSGVLVILLTVAALFTPWERSPRQLVIIVPTLDLAIVALMRLSLFPDSPIVVMLVVSPVLWLCYMFANRGLVIAILGSVVVGVLPYLWPRDITVAPQNWVGLILLPLIVTFIGVGVRFSTVEQTGANAGWLTVPAQLKESRMQVEDNSIVLQTIADTVQAAIVMYDEEGKIVLTNEMARALYAKAGMVRGAEEPREANIFRADGTTRVAMTNDIIAETLSGDPIEEVVYWIGNGDDRVAVITTSRKLERDAGGRLGTVVVAHDVTRLMEDIEFRDAFLAQVSHELRTPLTNIIGYADLIEAEELGIAVEMGVIEKNAQRLLTLISDLLTAGGGKAQVNRASVDIVDIVSVAIDAVRGAAAAGGLTIGYTAPEPILAMIDRRRVRQIADNLLSNAVKFTPVGGTVSIQLEQLGADVQVRIADTGTGVTPVDQKRMFDRFFRAQSVRAAAIPGAGLGLSIVKELVDAHGGSVTVQSEWGVGTAVTVRLPLRDVARV